MATGSPMDPYQQGLSDFLSGRPLDTRYHPDSGYHEGFGDAQSVLADGNTPMQIANMQGAQQGLGIPNYTHFPRGSYGSVADMQRAALESGAQQANQSQAAQLIRARLSPSQAAAQQLGGQLPPGISAAEGVPFNPGNPLGGPLALGPGNPAAPMQQAFAARAPGQWTNTMNDMAGVSGGARAPLPTPNLGATDAAGAGIGANAVGGAADTVAADAAGRPGMFADIKGLKGTLSGGLDSLHALQGQAIATSGLAAKPLEAMAAHPGLSALGGLGLSMAANPVEGALQKAGAPSEASGAVHGAMEWGGTALMAPGVGVIAAPIAAIVGAGYGAVSGPLKDYYAVQHYGDYANQFVDAAHAYHADGQDPTRHEFGAAAMAIHNGKDWSGTIGGQQLTIPGSQYKSITDKALALQTLVGGMKAYQANGYSLTGPGSATANQPQQDQQRLAIQMGQAMGGLSKDFVNQGDAAAAGIRGQIAANPTLAPVMEADAASRQAYAHQMGDAFTAAATITPTINHMDAQVAYYQQLLQSIRAAQLSGSSGGSGSLSSQLAASSNPSQQAAQGASSNANYTTGTMSPAQQQLMAQQYAQQFAG